MKLKQNEAFPGPKVGPKPLWKLSVCSISEYSAAVQSRVIGGNHGLFGN